MSKSKKTMEKAVLHMVAENVREEIWSLDHAHPETFKNFPNLGFKANDYKIMAEILGLKKKKRNVKLRNMITYIMPDIAIAANDDDCKRDMTKHKLIQEIYVTRIHEEFLSDEKSVFRKNEISKEKNQTIDVSNFDDQALAVLDLINKIIESTDKKRDEAQKKSTNQIIKEVG